MKENINIEQADSLNYMNDIESETVDLIIADPPYNLNKDYGNKSDSKTFDEYIKVKKKFFFVK